MFASLLPQPHPSIWIMHVRKQPLRELLYRDITSWRYEEVCPSYNTYVVKSLLFMHVLRYKDNAVMIKFAMLHAVTEVFIAFPK